MSANHRSATISVRCVNWNSWNSCEFLLALSAQLWRHWSTSVNRDQWDHCESQHPPLCIYDAVKDTPHDDSEWDILHLTWLHFSSVAQKKRTNFHNLSSFLVTYIHMHIHDANISMCGPCFVDQAVFLAVYKLDRANSHMLLNMFFVQSLSSSVRY